MTKVIIIDTTAYAGNFERELVAYVTGQVGECNVGYEAAQAAASELPPEVLTWFENHVEHTADEHGCLRPASLAPTPGWYNNGMGAHRRLKNPNTDPKYPAYLSVAMVVNEWPPAEIMDLIIARAKTFCAKSRDGSIPFVGIRCVERTTVETVVGQYE
jgi:hypothetical protein